MYALSELEAFCEDEFELFLHQQNGCHKKDRHGEFIPVQEFSIDNLVPPYKDQEIVKAVKLMAALTVRLRVRKISSLRPPPPYPPEKRVNKNGSPCGINGSGCVQHVWVHREESGNLCPCSECKESASARTSWGHILIITAGHVVFDSFEAEQTTCYFDFDEDDTDIASIPSLTCSKDFSPVSDTTCDIIELLCCTHDVDFAEKLENMFVECIIHQNILTRKYYGRSDTQALDLNYYHKALDFTAFIMTNKEAKNSYLHYEFVDHLTRRLKTQVQQECTGSNTPNEVSPTEIEMIHQRVDHYFGLMNTLVQQNLPTLPSDLQPQGNLVIVVSHPHGCGKYVSLGEYTSRRNVPGYISLNPAILYEYTAQTCPGSSGGPVFILSKETVGTALPRTHSRFLRKRNLSRCTHF